MIRIEIRPQVMIGEAWEVIQTDFVETLKSGQHIRTNFFFFFFETAIGTEINFLKNQ